MNDALAVCREQFAEFWGQRLLNVMRALHDVRYRQLAAGEAEEDENDIFGEKITEEELYEGLEMGDDE